MAYFPMFIELEGAYVLIVGGNEEAAAKVRRLLPYGPRLRVVAADPCPALLEIPNITLEPRNFQESDLQPAPAMVILTQGDRTAIARLCQDRRIPVNSADDPENCDFYFASLVKRGNLSIGICSGGTGPAVSAEVRELVETALPDATDVIIPWLAELTCQLRQTIPDPKQRGPLLRKITRVAFKLGRPLTEAELKQSLAPIASARQSPTSQANPKSAKHNPHLPSCTLENLCYNNIDMNEK